MKIHRIKLLTSIKSLSLKEKIIFLFTLTSTLILVFILFLTSTRFNRLSVETAKSRVNLLADKEVKKIEVNLEKNLSVARTIASSICISIREGKTINYQDYNNLYSHLLEQYPEVISVWDSWELKFVEPGYAYENGRIKNYAWREGGKILTNTIKNEKIEASADYLVLKANKSESLEEPYFDNYEGQTENILMTSVIAPCLIDGNFAGVAGLDIPLSNYHEIVKTIKPYRDSYAFIVSPSFKFIAHPDKDLIGDDALFSYESVFTAHGVQDKIINGEPIDFEATDINGKLSYFTFRPISVGKCPQHWSLVLVTPRQTILAEANHIFWSTLVFGIIAIILLSGFIYLMTMKLIINPISRVTENLERLSKGHVDNSMIVEIDNDDEIGKMIKYLNKTVEGLYKKTEFAQEVGKGNYDSTLELLSDEDILGKSLIEMNENLRKAKEEALIQQREEEKRRWINEGLAKFGDILRQNNDNLEALSANIVKNLVNILNANQGGLFIYNDDNTDEPYFELTAAYAYNRQKFIKKQILLGEGLVGTCALEKQTIYLKEIPENYITISSGLGEAKPRNLLIVPLKVEEKIYGVLELASFNEFEDYQIEFVERVAQSIGQTIQSVRTNIRTAKLLEKTQQQAEEMKAQEEEVRQNLEELETIKEELEKRTAEMEENQKQLEWEKSLLDSLLNYLPDKIYFKDLKSRFIKVSKSTLEFFGMTRQEELIGKSDFDFFTEEHARPAYEDEQRIIRTDTPIIGIVEKEVMNDGRVTWAETSKLPLKNSFGETIGTFGITRDITASKMMEEEITKKAEKEAAFQRDLQKKVVELENLYKAINDSAYVIEYSPEGNVTFINDAYLQLLNLNAEDVIGKHHSYQMEFTDEQRKNYKQFWEDLNNGIVRKETSRFTVNDKTYLFYETYTPIKDADGNVFKIMKIAFNVSHLLTDNQIL
jgi:PAS domain S-box-containing protein